MNCSVTCSTHGPQPKTYVCQHIAKGLLEKQRVGFFWTMEDPDNPRPDAWCGSCEDRVKATGGEWIGVAHEHLKATVLCGSCYDVAKMFHLGGNPWC